MNRYRARPSGGAASTTVTSQATAVTGAKRSTSADWKAHFEIFEKLGPGKYLFLCLHCHKGQDKDWSSNATRAKHHLAGTKENVVEGKQGQLTAIDSLCKYCGCFVLKESRELVYSHAYWFKTCCPFKHHTPIAPPRNLFQKP